MRPIQSTLLRHLAMHAMRPDVYCTCPLPPECSAVEIPITVILSVLIISVPLIAVVGVESIATKDTFGRDPKLRRLGGQAHVVDLVASVCSVMQVCCAT